MSEENDDMIGRAEAARAARLNPKIVWEQKTKAGKSAARKMGKKSAAMLHDGSIEPFPLDRFLKFVSVLKIQSKDYGLVGLQLLGTQRYALEEICKGIEEGVTTFMILKGRQQGMSTMLLALDLFWAMENEGLLGIFATHEEGSRDQFRNQIEVFFQTIPKSYQVGYTTSNRTMLVLENNSLFRYLIAGTRGSTNKLGRSGGCNFLHATECAFWGSADDLSALNQTLSEIYPHRLYIYESTANGFNHWQEMWQTAVDSPAMRAIFVGWWRNELYAFNKGHPLYLKYMPDGVETGLTQQEKKMVGEVREQFGVQLTAGQLAWYRHHLETKCNGDMNQMLQEHPHTPEAAFVSTGSQFFTNEALTGMMRDAKAARCMPFSMRLTKNPGDTAVMSATIARCDLKIWEEPSPFGKYVMGCDSAFGSDPDNDNSVISVGRCYADCVVQVAEFSSAVVQPYQLAWILAYLAGLYKDVMVILEMNGAGSAVFGELERLRGLMSGVATPEDMSLKNCLKYMKEYLYRREDSLGGGLMRQWVTSPSLKEKLMERYKTGFETNRVRIRSLTALEEHRKIVRDEGTIAGSGRSHDDRVIAAALFYWAWDSWIRNQMSARGQTIKKETEMERKGGPDPVNALVSKFMANRGIKINDEVNDER